MNNVVCRLVLKSYGFMVISKTENAYLVVQNWKFIWSSVGGADSNIGAQKGLLRTLLYASKCENSKQS